MRARARVVFAPKVAKLLDELAKRFTERYAPLGNRWVYDQGRDYLKNNRMAVAGKIAAAVLMEGDTCPTESHRQVWDFVAGGWRVLVRTTEGSTLAIREGHLYKAEKCDVLALVQADGSRAYEFLGWIWAHEFLVKAKPGWAPHTEPARAITGRKLLKPPHWSWILRAPSSGRQDAKGPPWPSTPGPHRRPKMGAQFSAYWQQLKEAT